MSILICIYLMIHLSFLRHGLGDTYSKLFCDPKMPFADCASKWYASHKSGTKSDAQKISSDEEDPPGSEETAGETRMSLRRSKRTSNNCDRMNEDDTDALSELETLAKLGRTDETLRPDWFSERALETRLHHIAHAVQNREWPVAAKPEPADAKHATKRHIAIDVETDRAKLHALLSSPAAAHSGAAPGLAGPGLGGSGLSASDSAAPPPAHQRLPAPAAAAAPVDLSAPLDLSDVHDFSVGRRTPLSDSAPSAGPSRSRLDDTLSRLMKRKNVVSTMLVIFDKLLKHYCFYPDLFLCLLFVYKNFTSVVPNRWFMDH